MPGSTPGATLDDFIAGWELFRYGTLTGIAAGAMLGALGVYVVLRRLVFLSAAVSQVSALGVAGAFYAEIHLGLTGLLVAPELWAALATFGALAALGWGRGAGTGRQDARLGVVFLAGLAGTMALASRISQELHDVESLLFGTAVAVLPEDLARVAWMSAGMLGLHLWLHRGFAQASFDPDGARVRRLPVGLLDAALLASLGLAVALTTRVLGTLPVFAFCVLPALAAIQLAPNPQWALLVGALLGALYGFLGYLVAVLWDLPVGPSDALVALGGLGLARVLRLVLGRLQPGGAARMLHTT